MNALYYRPGDCSSAKALSELFAGKFTVKAERERMAAQTLFDTFDWRLFAAGMSLREVREEGAPVFTEWREEVSDALLGRMEGGLSRKSAPAFGAGVNERLSQILKLRALMPVLTISATWRQLLLRDASGKTTVKLKIKHWSAGKPGSRKLLPLPPTLKLIPLKGYEKEAREARRLLEEKSKLTPAEHSTLALAFQAAGVKPLSYSSKVGAKLNEGMAAEEALRIILSRLAEIMTQNEDGVLKDIDTEFLHDFRVAVRRTRSALGQMKKAVPATVLKEFKAGFGWLGTVTGPTRDLDVYLLKLPGYAKALDPATVKNLEPLFRHIEVRRKGEQEKLKTALLGKRFKSLKKKWGTALGKTWNSSQEWYLGRLPAKEVADRRIFKLYKSIAKQGALLTPESAPEAVHRLRIAAKKLRYMIEFFSSLHPPEKVSEVVAKLKILQDTLGDFQDFEVHRLLLYRFAEELCAVKPPPPPMTFFAMGELAESIAGRQREARSALGAKLEEFTSQENSKLIKSVFGAAGSRLSNESSGNLQH